jgi:hypothetical protein
VGRREDYLGWWAGGNIAWAGGQEGRLPGLVGRREDYLGWWAEGKLFYLGWWAGGKITWAGGQEGRLPGLVGRREDYLGWWAGGKITWVQLPSALPDAYNFAILTWPHWEQRNTKTMKQQRRPRPEQTFLINSSSKESKRIEETTKAGRICTSHATGRQVYVNPYVNKVNMFHRKGDK